MTPTLSRRTWLGLAGAVAIAACAPRRSSAQPARSGADQRPDPSTFQTGDLIWPKTPGKYVPYNSQATASYEAERQEWERMRDEIVQKIRNDPQAPPHMKDLATKIQRMSFREFLAIYQADEDPSVPGEFGARFPLYVGHVGIVVVGADGTASVVEAVMSPTPVVQQISYADWLAARPDDMVWHGRVRDRAATDRARIADEARKYLGKPYDFWNFDLANTDGFYCSKLAWLAIRDALKFAVDGVDESKRGFWFSPKQLMNSKHVYLPYRPGNYGTP